MPRDFDIAFEDDMIGVRNDTDPFEISKYLKRVPAGLRPGMLELIYAVFSILKLKPKKFYFDGELGIVTQKLIPERTAKRYLMLLIKALKAYDFKTLHITQDWDEDNAWVLLQDKVSMKLYGIVFKENGFTVVFDQRELKFWLD